jgi:predicted RecA/RadA family phage recombinase
MAKNVVFEEGDQLSVVCTQPATPVSGDPVLFGDLPGVALTDEGKGGNAATRTSVKLEGVIETPVKGINGGGNSAVADGDVIYYVAGDTPPLSKKATGVRFGVAMGKPTDTGNLVGTGATATIRVRIGY